MTLKPNQIANVTTGLRASFVVQVFAVLITSLHSALQAAANWASTVEQRQPLVQYRARSVWIVRAMLQLPDGAVRIVCNTSHTPEQVRFVVCFVAISCFLSFVANMFICRLFVNISCR